MQGLQDLRVDKKEQTKSLKTIQDYFDQGDYTKAVKYCNQSKSYQSKSKSVISFMV